MPEIDALIGQLQDKQVEVRAVAAEQLCQMGEEAQGAAAALVRAAGDEESVSTWAVAALEEMGSPPAESIAELAELSASTRELVAYWAITLLGRLGTDATRAEQTLATALSSSPHLAVQQRSAWALGKLGGLSATAIKSLQQASQASDPRLAQLATRALAASSQ
jgi:HEAT repeat protein